MPRDNAAAMPVFVTAASVGCCISDGLYDQLASELASTMGIAAIS